MDPFEARLQFIQLLETVNPSSQSMGKTTAFAIKFQDLHEDFHSCILEVLNKVDLNIKINIVYFIENLLNKLYKKDYEDVAYFRNIERDFPKIVENCLPNDNLINLINLYEILNNLEKLFGKADQNRDLRTLFDSLDATNYDVKVNEPGEASGESSGFRKSWLILIAKKEKSIRSRIEQLHAKSDSTEDVPLTKEQILNRIETDRERHKKTKEINWIINRNDPRTEFDKLYVQFDKGLSEKDFRDLKELTLICNESKQV